VTPDEKAMLITLLSLIGLIVYLIIGFIL